jgi:hypothetical protein
MVLQDTGVLRNTDSCQVTTEGVQLYPLLDGETVFDSQAPSLYTPSLPEMTSAEEIQLLKKLSGFAKGSALGIADAAQPVVTDFSTVSPSRSPQPGTKRRNKAHTRIN